MNPLPKPRIKWCPTWGQFMCFDKSTPMVYGYASTIRESYRRWYVSLMKRTYPGGRPE